MVKVSEQDMHDMAARFSAFTGYVLLFSHEQGKYNQVTFKHEMSHPTKGGKPYLCLSVCARWDELFEVCGRLSQAGATVEDRKLIEAYLKEK